MENPKTKVIAIRLPADIADGYTEKAKEFNITRSTLLGLALRLGWLIINDNAKSSDDDADDADDVFGDMLATAERSTKKCRSKAVK